MDDPDTGSDKSGSSSELDEPPTGFSSIRERLPRLLLRGDAEPEDPPDCPSFRTTPGGTPIEFDATR